MDTQRVTPIAMLVFLFAPFCATSATDERPSGDSAIPDETVTQRLEALGRLWGKLRLLHPYLAYRDIDLDSALAENLDALEAAQSTEELEAALNAFLEVFNDPFTVARRANVSSVSLPGVKSAVDGEDGFVRMLGDGVMLVDATGLSALDDPEIAAGRMREQLAEAEPPPMVLFDLRYLGANPSVGAEQWLVEFVLDRSGVLDLVSRELTSPVVRRRVHHGFPDGSAGSIYWSGFTVNDGKAFRQSREHPADAVFLVNRHSYIPLLALALQNAGHAFIISEGEGAGESLVNTDIVAFGDGLEVSVRTSELLHADGRSGFVIDKVIEPAGDPERARQAALEYARAQGTRSESRPVLAPVVPASLDEPYPEMTFPERAYRLLALYRLWNYVDRFFPYKELASQPWKPRLAEYIPRFLGARDATEYALAAAELVAHMDDNHAALYGKPLSDHVGVADVPVTLMFVEGRPVVVLVSDLPEARESGITIGDEIVAIDGVPVEQRISMLAPVLSGSNDDAHMRRIAFDLLKGPEGSIAELQVRRDDGLHAIHLPRSSEFASPWRAGWRSGETVKVLEDNIGYVDLDRLRPVDVDAMFETLKETRAIIFDVRGYPKGTAWRIGPRLGLLPHEPVAEARTPIVQPSPFTDITVDTAQRLEQFISDDDVPWIYEKPAVMLVDARTQSHAEHTGLILVAANDATVIGSRTAGANGNVAFFTLPGGLRVRYTGLEVAYPGGRQLQRNGLAIDVQAEPSIKGIREGRDEVLERAVEYVNQVVR